MPPDLFWLIAMPVVVGAAVIMFGGWRSASPRPFEQPHHGVDYGAD